MHRFVLAEFNTHRVFSRNSESSRAVPTWKRLDKVREHPAIPVSFPAEQRGMQGGAELSNTDAVQARLDWLHARDAAVDMAESMVRRGVHKSVVNRILEPFLWHTVVVTATEWDGFYHQRCDAAAQPEIRLAAEAMRTAMDNSEPKFVNYGEWHLPFITDEDLDELWEHHNERYEPHNDSYLTRQFDVMMEVVRDAKRISAARCARTSYVTHDGVRSLEKDLELYERLAVRLDGDTSPHHWSPLEHVATPCYDCKPKYKHMDDTHDVHPGNFRGWFQHRHELDTSPY